MKIEIEYEVFSDEDVNCNWKITDGDFVMEDICRMSYIQQFKENHFEWESPNSDLGSLLGLEDCDEYPDYDWGDIIRDIEDEIQTWLNENMKNKNTN